MQRPNFYARPTQVMGCDCCATPLDRIERYSRKETLQSTLQITSNRTEHNLLLNESVLTFFAALWRNQEVVELVVDALKLLRLMQCVA